MYACAYAVAREKKDELCLDISSYYNNDSYRPFMLDKFNIKAGIMKIPKVKNQKIQKLFRYLVKQIYVFGYYRKIIVERECDYYKFNSIDYIGKKDIVLRGYWQNYRYFLKYKKELIDQYRIKERELSFDAKQLAIKMKKQNSVAIHIRGGDYPKEWRVSYDFYMRALSFIKERLHDICFYVFCKNNDAGTLFHKKDNVLIVSKIKKFTDLEEFYLMSMCRNQIIANSTYSWWAAFLNTNKDKIVIAPKIKNWDESFYFEGTVVL